MKPVEELESIVCGFENHEGLAPHHVLGTSARAKALRDWYTRYAPLIEAACAVCAHEGDVFHLSALLKVQQDAYRAAKGEEG